MLSFLFAVQRYKKINIPTKFFIDFFEIFKKNDLQHVLSRKNSVFSTIQLIIFYFFLCMVKGIFPTFSFISIILCTFAPIMTQEERIQIEERIVDVLKTVYDPEIPVNIFDLGMIYKIDVRDDGNVDLDMTFTAPNCPAADYIMEDVRTKVDSVEGVKSTNVNLVFEPAWDQTMMSEEARVELGFE